MVSFESIDFVLEDCDIFARQKSDISHLALVKTQNACLSMCLTLVSLSLTFRMTSQNFHVLGLSIRTLNLPYVEDGSFLLCLIDLSTCFRSCIVGIPSSTKFYSVISTRSTPLT
ncbi:hypothetical protein FGO68_gene15056 [Halteria grandinella]|uniref:Uncharacterized protein n=1 Tax=Halteria grandinella TaxID=5974 RepID=A0A8J8P739_HALGN|nr:hypothetical protein FGO68_gene15056 [Halteria grandinella]